MICHIPVLLCICLCLSNLHYFMASPRSMFIDKFLLWKVFPVSCLKWILQFAVRECPPGTSVSGHNRPGLLKIVQRLLATWSKKEFVQTAPIEQQACILFHHSAILKKHVGIEGYVISRVHEAPSLWDVGGSNVCSLTCVSRKAISTPPAHDCQVKSLLYCHAMAHP